MLYILSIQLKFILLHIVSYSNLKTIKTYETPKIQYDIVLHDANVVASYDNMILYQWNYIVLYDTIYTCNDILLYNI